MRHRYIGGAVLAAVVAVGWPSAARAQQTESGLPGQSLGVEGGFQVPLNAEPVVPIPTGQAGAPGFYAGAEFVMLFQTKAIGTQVVAVHGFNDALGLLTGIPGTFIGSGVPALTTNQMGGGSSGQPGFRAELGYKFDTGTRVYANYMQVYDAHYSAGATLAVQGFRSDPALVDTFLSSPVYNFTVAFGGPLMKTAPDATNGGFTAFGIWNGASIMDTKFTQRFQQAEAGLRTPMFATEYSSIYALAGARFAWFYERFYWRTQDIANDGTSTPLDVAIYTNNLSQRMYGLFIGCGHEVYLGSMFSASLDLTAAGFLDVVKGRAKYKLGDDSQESKFGRETFTPTASGTAELNLWFYPVEGVQMRLGYQALTFFNTRYESQPIGFNFGNINPDYGVKWFRLVHGINVGIGFFF
jgi:hypothetical protein